MIAVFFAAGTALAAEENMFTCSLNKAFECSVEDGCRESSIREMALPRFIRVDLKARTIQSLDKDVTRVTGFREMDRVNDLLIMHGTEQRGWSMALGENSRDLTLSASGDGESFVVFGSCMSQ
jgi:hypothetical protein